MGQTTNQIEAHIEDTRADLGANLHELEQKVKSVTDWKQHFRNNPMTMIGVAFGGGIMLATMMGGRRHRRGREYRPAGSDYQSSNRTTPNKALETLDTLKDVLIGVAATKVKDFVGNIVPGFQDELRRREEKTKTNPTWPLTPTDSTPEIPPIR